MRWRLRKFIRIFLGVVTFGATVVGAYVGALAVHLLLAFWLVIPIATLAGLGGVLSPKLVDLAVRVRNHPKLLQVVGNLTAENEDLKRSLAASRDKYELGIREGRAEVAGILLGIVSEAKLRVESMKLEDDRILLAAALLSGEFPPLGSRYSICVRATGEEKASAVVTAWDEGRRIVWLSGIGTPDTTTFWSRLTNLAIQGSALPEGLELVPPGLPLAAIAQLNSHVGGTK